MLSIIVGYNTAQFVNTVEMRQQKRKLFLNFLIKTCTVIMSGVQSLQKLPGVCSRVLSNFLLKDFKITQTQRPVVDEE